MRRVVSRPPVVRTHEDFPDLEDRVEVEFADVTFVFTVADARSFLSDLEDAACIADCWPPDADPHTPNETWEREAQR